MRRGLWLLTVILIAAGCAMRPLPSQRQPTEAHAERARWLVAAVLDAWQTHDTPRLEAYLAPETSGGIRPEAAQGRAALLDWLAAHAAELEALPPGVWERATLTAGKDKAALVAIGAEGMAQAEDWLLLLNSPKTRFTFVLRPAERGWRLALAVSIPNPPLN